MGFMLLFNWPNQLLEAQSVPHIQIYIYMATRRSSGFGVPRKPDGGPLSFTPVSPHPRDSHRAPGPTEG